MKQPQATDSEIASYLAANLYDHAYHDGRRWHYLHGGVWRTVRGPSSPLWAHLDRLREQLPADSYWDRARYRMSNISSTYPILSLVAFRLYREAS